jgi:short-subunit dehydrogenase
MKSPRSILVTGASSGLGAALARAYAAEGVALALTGRDQARLNSVATACEAAGASVATATIDVTDAAAIAAWIAQVDAHAPIELGIVNAGITGGTGGRRKRETFEAINRVLAVNLGGAINTIEPLLDAMQPRRRGQIAIVSSLAGLRGLPYSPTYSASKAALIAYGEALRAKLRRDGIAVNVICPGFVETPLDDSITGPKPLRITAARAARIIRRGLARNRARIAFPRLLYWATLAMRAIPAGLVDPVMAKIAVEVPAPVPAEPKQAALKRAKRSGGPTPAAK